MKSETTSENIPNIRVNPFYLGKVIVDPKRMSVSLGSDVYQLTDLTWRFLMALIDAAPDVAKYNDLAKSVWKQNHVSDETMAQRLRQLRQALGDNSKAPNYIRTVRGEGYQLIAEISKFDTEQDKVPTQFPIKWLVFSGATIIIAALLWFGQNSRTVPKSAPITVQPSVNELVTRANQYRNPAQYEANETAIGLYEKALSADKNNQEALIGLSFALSHKSSKFTQSNEWADQAARFADRAILYNPNSAGAFAARGMADDARGRVSSAIDYYRKSHALNPNDKSIISSTAYLLQIQGKFHDALVLEKLALDKGASTHFSDYQIALVLDAVGLTEPSEKWLKRATLLSPDNVFLTDYKARQLIKTGEYEKAIQWLEDLRSNRPTHYIMLTQALLLAGHKDRALQSANTAYEFAKKNHQACYECLAVFVSHGQSDYLQEIELLVREADVAIESGDEWPSYRVELAYIKLASDDVNGALESIQQAYDLGYRDWKWLKITPLLAQLRSHPEFNQLLYQMQIDIGEEKAAIVSDNNLTNFLLLTTSLEK